MSNFLILNWTVWNSYLTFKSGETYLTFQKNIIFECSIFWKWLHSPFLAKNETKSDVTWPTLWYNEGSRESWRVLGTTKLPETERNWLYYEYNRVIPGDNEFRKSKYHENEHGTYSHMEHWFNTHSCSMLLTVNILGTHFKL